MTPQVFISGMHIADDGTLVVHADEMAEAGVKSIEFIEGTPEARIEELETRLSEAREECAQAIFDRDEALWRAEIAEGELAEANKAIEAQSKAIQRYVKEHIKLAAEAARLLEQY